MARKDKLPKGIHQQDKITGNSKKVECPNCYGSGKIGSKDCIACRGTGRRWQQQGEDHKK